MKTGRNLANISRNTNSCISRKNTNAILHELPQSFDQFIRVEIIIFCFVKRRICGHHLQHLMSEIEKFHLNSRPTSKKINTRDISTKGLMHYLTYGSLSSSAISSRKTKTS